MTFKRLLSFFRTFQIIHFRTQFKPLLDSFDGLPIDLLLANFHKFFSGKFWLRTRYSAILLRDQYSPLFFETSLQPIIQLWRQTTFRLQTVFLFASLSISFRYILVSIIGWEFTFSILQLCTLSRFRIPIGFFLQLYLFSILDCCSTIFKSYSLLIYLICFSNLNYFKTYMPIFTLVSQHNLNLYLAH